MKRPAAAALTIDVLAASRRWRTAKIQSVLRRAVTSAAAAIPSTSGTEVAIVLTDDSAIRVLNRDWRSVDAATNVLSFPAKSFPAQGGRSHLGDIVLAFETIAREARNERKPFAHHVAHLAVHGFLHLLGYDHERDEDARDMERTERKILRQLGIPDPYAVRPGKTAGAAGTAGGSRKNSINAGAERPGRKVRTTNAKESMKESAKRSPGKSAKALAARSARRRARDTAAIQAGLAAKKRPKHHGRPAVHS